MRRNFGIAGLIALPLVVILKLMTMSVSIGSQSPVVSPTSDDQSATQEIAILRAQLEQMQGTDERLLQIVLWALASIITVAVVLVGYSWFSSVRSYERELGALRQELQGALTERVSNFESQQRDNQNERLTEAVNRMNESLTESMGNARQSLSLGIERLRTDVDKLRFDVLSAEAERYEERGNKRLALSRHIEIIEVGQKMKWAWIVAKGLEGVKRTLQSGAEPDYSDTMKITSILDGLPADYSADAQIVRKLVQDARE